MRFSAEVCVFFPGKGISQKRTAVVDLSNLLFMNPSDRVITGS